MNITSETPALAKTARATRYTLARQLTTVRLLSGKPFTPSNAVYDTLDTVTFYATRRAGSYGLTFSNAL